MGFRTIAICYLLVIAISCSKPSQENNSGADSTAASQSIESKTPNLPPASLSSEEQARINTQLFLFIREALLSNDNVAYKEEFVVNDNEFKYTLLRHNGDYAGMTSDELEGTRPMTPEEQQDWEADSTHEGDAPQVPYKEVRYFFTPEIDTFYVTGNYTAYLKSNPEETPKVFEIMLVGKTIHKSANYVQYGEPHFSAKEYEIGDTMDFYIGDVFDVDFRKPFNFRQERLYLLAKVRELTDDDVKGLDKEQLSIVRNDIFAHHGHTFKTPRMVNHYKATDWYHPIIDDASSLLNNFEKSNVEFLKKKEG